MVPGFGGVRTSPPLIQTAQKKKIFCHVKVSSGVLRKLQTANPLCSTIVRDTPEMARNKQQKNKGPSTSFDETALASLTAKIGKKIGDPGDDDRSGKRKRQDGGAGSPLPKKRQVETAPLPKKRQVETAPLPKKRQVETAPLPKKRQAETETSEPRQNGRKGGKGKKGAVKLTRSELLEEILALGGDEEDLDLVTGIDSDVEDGAPKSKPAEAQVDDFFKNELAKFASGLGFENLPQEDDAATDDEIAPQEANREEEEEEEEAEGDEAQNEEEEEEIDEPEPVEEEPVKGKKAGKLVSKRRVS